ncbi:MAG: hypothetical protein AB1772_12900 [Candidatus Zixiibacteriota bacterium]
MSHKVYLIVSGIVFLLVAAIHFLRLVNQWPVVVGTSEVPMAVSYVGLPAALLLCIWAGWLLRNSTRNQG